MKKNAEFDKAKVEEFDSDILKSNQEYLDMINEMQNLYGEGDKSNKILDEMIEHMIVGMNRRVALQQKCEKKYLKQQLKEWNRWQKWLKQHKEPAKVQDAPPEPPQESPKSPTEQSKALPSAKPKHSLLAALMAMFKRIGYRPDQAQGQAEQGEQSPSQAQAPPEAESPKPEAQEEQSEAIEGEVFEEDEEEQDDSNSSDDEVEDESADDGVMKF